MHPRPAAPPVIGERPQDPPKPVSPARDHHRGVRRRPPGLSHLLANEWVRWGCYAVVVAVATVVVIGPSALAWRGGFMAWKPPYPAPTPPGDHLQVAYSLWLWQHEVVTLRHLPWVDPYQFGASGQTNIQPFGWPVVLLSVPVGLIFGAVAAYNVTVVLAFVGCALATAALARAIGLSRPAAWVAGFAFAFAPFRVLQATTHANAILSPLLPLLLLGIERALAGGPGSRRWAWFTVICYLSLLGSGEPQLAVYATMLGVGYLLLRAAVLRPPWRPFRAPALVLVGGTAVLAVVIDKFALDSGNGGRSHSYLDAAAFAPRLSDVVSRHPGDWTTFERFAYPGAVIAALAAVGLVITTGRSRQWRLLVVGLFAGVLVAYGGAVVPGFDGHPSLQRAVHDLPGLSDSRTPGRIVIVACCLLALLAGFGIDALKHVGARRALAVVALLAITIDAPRGIFAADGATPHLLSSVPAGATVVDLPVLDAGNFSASIVGYGIITSPGPRAGGYSVLAPPAATAVKAETAPLSQLPVDACAWQASAARLHLQYVAVHLSMYGPAPLRFPADGAALVAALHTTPGFSFIGQRADTSVFQLQPDQLACRR